MTANPPMDEQTTPKGVSVDIQDVIERYSAELAQATSRAIVAEAGMASLQRELATLQQTLHDRASEPEPEAPTREQRG
jgi:hypothetical protein